MLQCITMRTIQSSLHGKLWRNVVWGTGTGWRGKRKIWPEKLSQGKNWTESWSSSLEEKQESIFKEKRGKCTIAGLRADGMGGSARRLRTEVVDSDRPEFETWSAILRLCDFGQVVKPLRLHLPVCQIKMLGLLWGRKWDNSPKV